MLTYPMTRRLGRRVDPSASFTLNFADRKASIVGKPVSLRSLIAFDRAGPAWGLADGGVMRLHAADEMRLERLGTGQGGLVVERAATNLIRNSRDLSALSWTVVRGTTAQTATGIDGKETVSYCTDTAAAGSPRGTWTQVVGIDSASQWVTCSIYIRQTVGKTIRLYAGLAGGSSVKGGSALFDTEIGAVLTSDAGVLARIEPAAMGFIRLVISVQNDVAGSACVLVIGRDADASAKIEFAADFAQMEFGSRPSTPIATSNDVVTRAGERARILPMDDWFNPYQGTLFIEAKVRGGTEFDRTLIRLAGPDGSLEIAISANGSLSVISVIGGVAQAGSSAAGYVNPPRIIRLAVRYKPGDFAFAVSGLLFPYDGESLGTPRVTKLVGAATVPTYTAMEIGALVGTRQMDGCVQSVVYIPFALDDDRLAAAVL